MNLIQSFKSLLRLLPPSPVPEEEALPTERASVHLRGVSMPDLKAKLTAAEVLDRRRKRERSEVKALMSSGDLSGDNVFLQSGWLHCWNEFLRGGLPPGPITFTELLDEYGDPRHDLQPDLDFAVIPKAVWDYLSSIYDSEPPLESPSDDISTAIRRSETFLSLSAAPTPLENDFPAFSLMKPHAAMRKSADVESRSSEATTTNLYTRMDGMQIRVTKGLVGLVNPGLYCYLNASIQLLMSVEPLRDFFLLRYYLGIDNRVRKSYSEAMGDVASALFTSSSGSARPSRLWSLTTHKFPPSKMHDAQEFIHFLLDSLDLELAVKRTKRPGMVRSEMIDTWFVGGMKSEVKCLECGKLNCVWEQFVELSLPMERSVKKALKLFCAKETLSAAYDCEKCRKKTDLTKGLRIEKSPLYLILSLKRFKQFPSPQKSNSFVKFHKRLQLPP